MKKYFVHETDEQVEFGDAVSLTFFKNVENGKVTIEKNILFSEETVDSLISMGFIDERSVEEEKKDPSTIDFTEELEFDEAWQELLEEVEDHDQRIETLEDDFNNLQASVIKLERQVKKLKQPKNLLDE